MSVKNFHQCVSTNVSWPTYFHDLLTNECLLSAAPGTRATKALFRRSSCTFPARAVNPGQRQSPGACRMLPRSLPSLGLRLISSRSHPDPLYGCHKPSHKETRAGARDWAGAALMQDFIGTALPECKHPSHLRTGTPAKTLKNKLHKHLWGGWTCHNRAVLHRGGRVASRTQGQYINLRTQGSLSHESKKTKQNTQGLRHHTKPQLGAGISH